MKKILTLAITCALLLLLSSCDVKTYEEGYEEGWAWGYDEGFMDGSDNGFDRGRDWAKSYLSMRIADDLSEVEDNIEEHYSMSPWEAIEILSNYADVPDEVSEDVLNDAIQAIYAYYQQVDELICQIDDYDLS